MMNRCANCPVLESLVCAGFATRRFCQLIDPSHVDYRPAYVETLRRMASPSPAYPSLVRQLATAAGAVGRAITAVATGQAVMVSIEQQQDRLAICRACEFLDVEQARCTRCGCHLPGITGKTALATEACPVDKW